MRILLSTGREISANRGLIGISVSGDYEVAQGHDGTLPWPPPEWDDQQPPLTAEDMRTLADLMIDRWTRFRDALR